LNRQIAGGLTTLHALLYACVGRARDVPLALWLLAALSAVLLVLR